jgi:putative transposase
VVGAHRSNVRYRSRRPPQTALRTRLKELATTHVSYGYLRLHVLLRREGWQVNRKRVYRLYREEGLMLKPRRPKRHRTAAPRVLRPATERPNERWAMDFVHDTLAGARTIRILTVLDVHTRECLALVPQPAFRGADVARILSETGTARGLPRMISVDNGAEFTSARPQAGARPVGVLEPRHPGLQPTGQADGQRAHRGVQPLAQAGVPACGLPRNTGSPTSLMPSSSSAPGRASTTTPGRTAAWSSTRRRIGASAATSSQAGNRLRD